MSTHNNEGTGAWGSDDMNKPQSGTETTGFEDSALDQDNLAQADFFFPRGRPRATPPRSIPRPGSVSCDPFP